MIKKIFAIFDAKADVFGAPILFSTEAEAIRAFGDIVNDKDSQYGRHPEDFALYFLGDFFMAQGKIDDHGEIPKRLILATSLIK